MAKSNNNNKNKNVRKSAVLYNWPGFYDVLNRPETEKEQIEFAKGMTEEGRGHEVMAYQIAVQQYKLGLTTFLNDINRNDRAAPEEFKGMIKAPAKRKGRGKKK